MKKNNKRKLKKNLYGDIFNTHGEKKAHKKF